MVAPKGAVFVASLNFTRKSSVQAVGQLSVNCWYTAGRQLAMQQYTDRLLGELFFTFSQISTTSIPHHQNYSGAINNEHVCSFYEYTKWPFLVTV